jgi:hypothetical protein
VSILTNYSNICTILGDLYINYKEDKGLSDFIEFNDLGLPLAYFQTEGLADVSEDGKKYILETWELFLVSLGLKDTGFDNLNQVFDATQNK